MDCCTPPDPNGLNGLFRGRYLDREVRRFERRGLDARQTFMLEHLRPSGRRVLDLGAGIGALGLTALRQGAGSALLVELSRPSLDAARGVADRLEVAGRAEFAAYDAAELPPGIMGDAVVLDRVVCCYPNGEALVRRAAAAAGNALVFSHPVPTWWTRVGRSLINAGMRLFGRDYRFYLHDPHDLLGAAGAHGHVLVERRRFGAWYVAVLERDDAPPSGR